ncbi:MAG: hypothetical protein ACPGXK_05530 [Phycisphaerae bacterium]
MRSALICVNSVVFILVVLPMPTSAASHHFPSFVGQEQTAATAAGGCDVCCLGEVCAEGLSPLACAQADGSCVPSGSGADCETNDPCQIGACCLSANACIDEGGMGISEEDCLDNAEGQYLGGVRCADDICPMCDIEDEANCQSNTGSFIVQIDRAVWNTPDQVERWADDFMPTTNGPMDRICWWPAFFNPFFGNECAILAAQPEDNWQLRIYEDGGGYPGAEIGSAQTIDPDSKVSLGTFTRVWLFSAPVPTPPMLVADTCYWIEITGEGDGLEGCRTYWALSGDGNSYSVQDFNNSYGPEDVVSEVASDPNVDLSFCIPNGLEQCGPFSGACCSPDLSCEDNVDLATCEGSGGVWIAGASCDDVDVCPIPCEAPTCEAAIDLNAPGSPCASGPPCDIPFDNRFCDLSTVDVDDCRGSFGTTAVGHKLYYKYTFPEGPGGVATLSTCGGTEYNSVIAIYESCDTSPNNYFDCADDTCGFGSGPSEAVFEACGGCTYYFVVGGASGESGAGTLSLSKSTVNGLACTCGVTSAPLADPIFDVLGGTKPCTTDADCKANETGPDPQTFCRDSTGDGQPDSCYVMRQRYISVKPNPANAGLNYALRVSLDTGEGGVVPLGFVQEATNIIAGANNGPSSYDKSVIGDTPFYQDWTTIPSGIISIGDCEISPNHDYVVQAIADGVDTKDESQYSVGLHLPTSEFNGDVTGGGSPGDPPNGAQGSIVDVYANVLGFQSNANEPLDWLDVDPATGAATPNLIVRLADAFAIVQAFQGNPYPGPEPLNCN